VDVVLAVVGIIVVDDKLNSKYLTNPVDVVLAVVGIIVVDDKLDVVHVQTAGRHVCGHQNTRGSGPVQTQPINYRSRILNSFTGYRTRSDYLQCCGSGAFFYSGSGIRKGFFTGSLTNIEDFNEIFWVKSSL
jgi:hypothetical protein